MRIEFEALTNQAVTESNQGLAVLLVLIFVAIQHASRSFR